MDSWRVLLVEDDARTRARFAQLISESPSFTLLGAAETCEQARALLADEKPDLLVTDIGLPDGSGLDLVRLARDTLPGCQIMVITVFGDEAHVLGAVEAGADGYLLKDGTRDEIVEALLDLARGGSPMSASIARHLLHRIRASQQTAPASDSEEPAARLTAREIEVLQLVAKGFSFAEIGGLLDVSTHTVRTHVRRMYRKLEVGSRNAAVYEAVTQGIIRME